MKSSRPSLDTYFVALLSLVATRSTCPRRAVGAIITGYRGKVLSTGYNGVPSGLPHCTDHPCPGVDDPSGDTSRCWAVHAEQNAILQAGDRIEDANTIYCTCQPCFTCAKLIANTPIQRVVFTDPYHDPSAMLLFRGKGIEVVHWNLNLR